MHQVVSRGDLQRTDLILKNRLSEFSNARLVKNENRDETDEMANAATAEVVVWMRRETARRANGPVRFTKDCSLQLKLATQAERIQSRHEQKRQSNALTAL